MDLFILENCRICLKYAPERIKIFETEDLCQQIALCTDVDFSSEEAGPENICTECLAELHISYEFRRKCQESDQRIREVLREFDDRKIEVAIVKREDRDEEAPNGDFADYQLFDNESVHVEEEHSLPRLRTRRRNKYVNELGTESDSDPHMSYALAKVRKKYGWKKKKKDKVGKRRGRKPLLLDPEEKFQCDVCGKEFAKKNVLNQHVRRHFTQTQYDCDQCSKRFSSNSNLKRHLLSHDGARPLNCDVCSMTFAKKRNLFIHRLRHFKIKNYSCEMCGMYFYTNGEVKTHMRKHTGDKLFTCSICGKSFTAKANLATHILSHSGEKPFSCDICQKKFISRNILKNHKRIHTGEKPFVCSVCGKRFTVNKLAIHMRTHTGERPHSCSICEKKFATSTSLHIHKRLHTGEKPYECPVCLRAFGHTQSRNKHIRRKHRILKAVTDDAKSDIKTDIHIIQSDMSLVETVENDFKCMQNQAELEV